MCPNSKQSTFPKNFTSETGFINILNIFYLNARISSDLAFWIADTNIEIRSKLSMVSQLDDSFYCTSPVGFQLEPLEQALEKQGHRLCLLRLSTPHAFYFFKSDFIGREPSGLRFPLPKELFALQRRHNLRLKISSNRILWLNFLDPVVSGPESRRKVIDLSTGGVSFQETSNIEDNQLQKHQIFKALSFTIRLQKICTGAKIQNLSKQIDIDGTSYLRVGLEFLGLGEAEKLLITDYVEEESKHQFK